MIQDEIIRMFHEAGELAGWKPGVGNPLVIKYLTRFAALAFAAGAAHEREKQANQEPVALIEECRDALAQELMAYDIDPPIHHVKQAHDKCVAWLSNYAAPTEPVKQEPVAYLSPNGKALRPNEVTAGEISSGQFLAVYAAPVEPVQQQRLERV